MKQNIRYLIAGGLITAFLMVYGCSDDSVPQKPGPDKVLKMMQQGNDRFVAEKPLHPHLDKSRLTLAGQENQGDFAYATVISCSDSRVPVEAIFDAGVMDIFVIRVAGNVCDTDEVGSIEYGLAHVNTPLMVVLGHTQCGAVTAVTHSVQGKGHALERNIPALVDNIEPAVRQAMAKYPHAQGDGIIPLAIEENVWTSIRDLFMKSPSTRQLVASGKVKVVGAVYDVSTGRVGWLKQAEVDNILHEVNSHPDRAIEAMAPHRNQEPEKKQKANPSIDQEKHAPVSGLPDVHHG